MASSQVRRCGTQNGTEGSVAIGDVPGAAGKMQCSLESGASLGVAVVMLALI